MALNELFKKRLRELRKETKETQVQVAQAIGTTGRYYQKLEAGESLPGLEYCCALADHFGVTIDYLAGRTDER
ncbi:MAG: helix-turn-helix transcriptional regulator [Oscillospiraceae bacterium]|jgi:transcriptional regulator with XRE-family HTH domain|nr:helix-turn-helix transcriptional regulator [Oscillospiraceae bacterium]